MPSTTTCVGAAGANTTTCDGAVCASTIWRARPWRRRRHPGWRSPVQALPLGPTVADQSGPRVSLRPAPWRHQQP